MAEELKSGAGYLSESEAGDAAVALLWDSLRRDPEHKDRRQTAWGTKTKEGLAACLARIYRGN